MELESNITDLPNDFQSTQFFSLPPEIFYNIFKNLDVKCLVENVGTTCKYFNCLLDEENSLFWKNLMFSKWPNCGKYPALNMPENIINWRKVCRGREKLESLWSDSKNTMIEYSNNRDFAGVVDCCTLYDVGENFKHLACIIFHSNSVFFF